MGNVVIKAKLLPENPEIDVSVWEEKVKSIIEADGELRGFNKEPIGFGLFSAIIIFVVPDKVEGIMDRVEGKLRDIEGVSDFRVESMDLE